MCRPAQARYPTTTVGRRGDYTRKMRRIVGLAGAVVGVFAVAVLVGALAGYFLECIGGSQQGEQTATSAPRSVTVENTVEKTIPVASPAPTPPEEDTITATTTVTPPADMTTVRPPATATATVSP